MYRSFYFKGRRMAQKVEHEVYMPRTHVKSQVWRHRGGCWFAYFGFVCWGLFFSYIVLPCRPDWPATCYVDQARPRLAEVCLPLPLECLKSKSCVVIPGSGTCFESQILGRQRQAESWGSSALLVYLEGSQPLRDNPKTKVDVFLRLSSHLYTQKCMNTYTCMCIHTGIHTHAYTYTYTQRYISIY